MSERGREGGRGSEGGRGVMVDVGGVIGAWIGMFALENVVVGVGWRAQFAGSWEMAHARYYLTPIAVAAAVPFALAAVAVGRLVAARNERGVGAVASLIGATVAVLVSTGRHLESNAVRVPFVAAVSLAAGAAAIFLVRRAPLHRPRLLATMGVLVAAAAWTADVTVLPRLYPAFHALLLGMALAGWATTFLLVRGDRAARPFSYAALALALFSIAWTPRSARAVTGDDNLRRVLVEHAPVLGRAVLLASRIAPPPALEDDTSEASTTAAVMHPKTAARSLDWSGRDIVVVTIDALRADHVSSYGYGRATTPNIDRLAARGVRFEHAYCPTPHTSYSVTSMMTGKYMRPLLTMGVGDDSETWAGYLRRYGFRTAAFYPPAVFFIDEHRFRRMKAEGLGFEYRKEEFAAPDLHRRQIADYVASAPHDKPLFLWVHLFEPHEPYVKHPEHTFGTGDDSVDAYDSEVAAADAEVGNIVEVVEKRRPGAVFVVSADHGEEFGDHGGRYHGTTVYEEQVRVPLVVVAPGIAPGVVNVPVQTIDLLPTTLAALDVPLPARVRGRDLGGLLAGKPAARDEGLAYAETDDYTLVARGDERLVCVRKIASCTLFDVRTDPLEMRPIDDRPARVSELRKLTAAIERENGKLETNALPEALRRGLQGNRDAAEDVAALFDDARVDIRREAARCAFRLKAPVMMPALRRAVAKDEDEEVRAWSGLALVRLGAGERDGGSGTGTATGEIAAMLRDPKPALRLGAALALAEQGDARGEAEIVARWEAAFVPGVNEPGELDEARELLAALSKIHARTAAPVLARSLADVRLRPYVAETLGELGDPRALAPLLATFAGERYVDARPKEARALVRLGAKDALLPPLRRFAGVPDVMVEAIELARDAGLLVPAKGGWRAPASPPPWHAEVDLTAPAGDAPGRLLVLGLGEGAVTAKVDGAPVRLAQHGAVWTAELPAVAPRARVEASSTSGIAALWLVRRAEEIPPPAPREWQAPDGGL
ncbi:MAG: Choline-sulfatase [Myxococcaceae bacterium]|nr:Choline-sulfatase [Myxococcaceae bacterium]